MRQYSPTHRAGRPDTQQDTRWDSIVRHTELAGLTHNKYNQWLLTTNKPTHNNTQFNGTVHKTPQVAQLSQRDCTAGWLVMAKSGRLELRDNIYGHYRSTFNHCDVIGQQSNQTRWKSKIRAITAFKVIEVGINRKPICDFLLVINSNWHPISYHFGVIAAYGSNFGHCIFSPLWRA